MNFSDLSLRQRVQILTKNIKDKYDIPVKKGLYLVAMIDQEIGSGYCVLIKNSKIAHWVRVSDLRQY